MSSEFSNLLALQQLVADDPKKIELVDKIAEKTRSGKIVWERMPSSLVASVPGMQMNFVRSSSPFASLFGTSGWEVFSVRTQQGAEVIKVEQPSPLGSLVSPTTQPPPRSKLLQSIDALYTIANSRGQSDIDKALGLLNNL